MNALASARAEMEKTVSELRIKRAISSKVPAGAYRVFDPEELVVVYHERLDEWKTPVQLREWKDKPYSSETETPRKPFPSKPSKAMYLPHSLVTMSSQISPASFIKEKGPPSCFVVLVEIFPSG
jgi:hypothetical protein